MLRTESRAMKEDDLDSNKDRSGATNQPLRTQSCSAVLSKNSTHENTEVENPLTATGKASGNTKRKSFLETFLMDAAAPTAKIDAHEQKHKVGMENGGNDDGGGGGGVYVNDDDGDGDADAGIDQDVEQLEGVLEFVKLEQNIQGLQSANARKRRQSHTNITSLLVNKNNRLKHRSNSFSSSEWKSKFINIREGREGGGGGEGSGNGGGSRKNTQEDKEQREMVQALNGRMNGIENKLDQLLATLFKSGGVHSGGSGGSGGSGSGSMSKRKRIKERRHTTALEVVHEVHTDPKTQKQYKFNPATGVTEWL